VLQFEDVRMAIVKATCEAITILAEICQQDFKPAMNIMLEGILHGACSKKTTVALELEKLFEALCRTCIFDVATVQNLLLCYESGMNLIPWKFKFNQCLFQCSYNLDQETFDRMYLVFMKQIPTLLEDWNSDELMEQYEVIFQVCGLGINNLNTEIRLDAYRAIIFLCDYGYIYI